MTKERIAGVLALALSSLIGLATLAHVLQLVVIVAQGRVATTALEARDGVVIYTQNAQPGGVAPESVIAGFVTDATILAVVALLIVIGSSLVRNSPFGPHTTVAVACTGIIIAVGGTIGAAFASFADRRSLPPHGDTLSGPLDVSFSILVVSLLPLVAGLTIVILAFVFRAGARIQNDTEGLV